MSFATSLCCVGSRSLKSEGHRGLPGILNLRCKAPAVIIPLFCLERGERDELCDTFSIGRMGSPTLNTFKSQLNGFWEVCSSQALLPGFITEITCMN